MHKYVSFLTADCSPLSLQIAQRSAFPASACLPVLEWDCSWWTKLSIFCCGKSGATIAQPQCRTYYHMQKIFCPFIRVIDPQAGVVSRIRCWIFIRQKSAEKVRLAKYYYMRKIPLHYYCISMLDSGERLNSGTGHVTPLIKTSFQVPIYIVIPLFASEKILSLRPSAVFKKKYQYWAEFQPYFYLSR